MSLHTWKSRKTCEYKAKYRLCHRYWGHSTNQSSSSCVYSTRTVTTWSQPLSGMLLFNTHLSHTTKTSLLHAQLSPGTADLACSGACEGTSSRQPEMLCSVQLALGSPASGGRAATQDSPKQQQLKSLFSCRVQLVSLPPILLTDVRKKAWMLQHMAAALCSTHSFHTCCRAGLLLLNPVLEGVAFSKEK